MVGSKKIAVVWACMGIAGAVGCQSNGARTASNSRNDVTDIKPTAAPASVYVSPTYEPQPVEAAPIAASEIAPPVVSTTPVTGRSFAKSDLNLPSEKAIASASDAAGSRHRVLRGETLFSIAKAAYGSGKQWKKIVSANPGVTASSLKVGQTITLPR